MSILSPARHLLPARIVSPARHLLPRRLTGRAVETLFLHAAAVLLVAVLVVAGSQGVTFALLALATAGFVAVLAALGSDRTGVLILAGAYFTAPMYKGLAPSPGSVVTPTDLLFVMGFALLLPRLLSRRVRLPALYLVGVLLVLVAGLVASAFSTSPAGSILALAFWMLVMLALPVAIAAWGPSGRIVDLFAASFVAGQIFSLAAGYVRGNSAQGRQAGLSTHPNLLAQGGMLALALLLYLVYRHRSTFRMALILGAGAICGFSVIVSGSRAATLVVAVLVLMIPVVERSALVGFVTAGAGALLIVGFPFIVSAAGPGSSIARLGGDTSAALSNGQRSEGLQGGVDRFFAHPLRGDGLVDLFLIHNNFLEVAVAIGIFGLTGYLMVLWAFARPLIFGSGEFRRLAYVVWAYVGFGATVPSLYDRSIWALVALSVVAMVEHERREDPLRQPPVRQRPQPQPHPQPRPPLGIGSLTREGVRRTS